MKKFMSLALALIMVLGLVACGGGGSTTSGATSGGTTSGATSGTTSEPHEVRDTLNIAVGEPILTTDPMANTKTVTMQNFEWVFEALVFADDEAVVHPRLAESWEVKNDGKDYVFKIRQGVKFHSGNEMTTDDVVFSLNRNKDMSYMKNYIGAIESIEKTGDWEVTVHLKSANNSFLYNLAVLKIVEKAVVESEGENFGKRAHLGATGPFKYVSFDPNTLVEYERNEDYWDKDSLGNITKLNAYIITNSTTRATALQTGEVDFIDCPTAYWDQIKNSGKFSIKEQEGTRTTVLILNFYRENSALNDIRVRQAMKYAINREAIVQVAAGGLGKVAYVLCNPTYIAGSSDKDFVGTFEYNPEKAKQLLADAGYANGVTIPNVFMYGGGYDNPAVAQMLQAMWEAVGIKVTLEQAESATASTKSKEGYQDVYITNSNYIHHMANLKRAIHSSTIKTQVAKYGNAELDSYMDNAEQALTDADRDKWYNEANKFLNDYAVNIPLYYMAQLYAWDPALDAKPGCYYQYIQYWNWT